MTTVFGCAAIGGLYEPTSAEDAHATLQAAWDLGMRRFDTAPYYGVGQSEEYLGEFLHDKGRESYELSTKIGRLLIDDPEAVDGTGGFFGVPLRSCVRDYSADGVRRSLRESLSRLQLDRVDLALVHDPEGHLAQAIREAAPTLAGLREEGTIAGFGVGTNFAEVAERFIRETACDTILIAGRYSLLDRRAERSLLPLCEDRGMTVQVAGVLNSGLLADPKPGAPFNYAKAPGWMVEVALRMAVACEKRGVSLRAAALQFPTRHTAVDGVVVGPGREVLVRDTVAQMRVTIPDELWAELDDLVPDQTRLP